MASIALQLRLLDYTFPPFPTRDRKRPSKNSPACIYQAPSLRLQEPHSGRNPRADSQPDGPRAADLHSAFRPRRGLDLPRRFQKPRHRTAQMRGSCTGDARCLQGQQITEQSQVRSSTAALCAARGVCRRLRLNSPARASLSARPPASSAREFYSVGLGSPAAGCNATTPLQRIDNTAHELWSTSRSTITLRSCYE